FCSYMAAVLIAVLGDHTAVLAARVVALVCGVASVVLVARLARRLAGPRAAWIAGCALAWWGTAIYFDATLLLTPLVTLMLLATADRLLAALDGPPHGFLAAAGALLGLLSITRANGLLAVVAAGCWAMLAARRGWLGEVTMARAAGSVLIPAILVVSPVTLRNTFYAHDPVIVSWNGGINLFMGNDPAFDQGSGNWHPDLTWTRLYTAPEKLGLTRGSEHQRFFLRQSVQRWLHDPAGGAALLARKALLLLTAYEIPNNRRFDSVRAYSPILKVLMAHGSFWALPLSLGGPWLAAGLVLAAAGGRRRGGLALLLLAVAWAAAPVLFFNTARYRLPALVLLMPVAAAGWVGGRRGRARVVAAVAGGTMLVVGAVTMPKDSMLPPPDPVLLGDVLDHAGRSDQALEAYRRAWQAEPDNPFSLARLGDALQKAGQCEQALPLYARIEHDAALDRPWRQAAVRSRGRCLALLGRFDEAEAAYREFLADDPDHPTSGERPEFFLRDIPPITACEYRGELADLLVRAGRRELAVVELGRILTECAEAEELSRRARQALRRLSGETIFRQRGRRPSP
ncbi:MAG: tetratricopeptide repeat protein, partial [Acidobacteriota bacterium]|nr:tetratricopeptide repeat protein [Acidobacteriota bacterium]